MVGNGLKRAGIWAAWFAAAFLAFGPSIGGRNGSGTYTIPNTFTAGSTITAAGHNQNFSDIATELTNSVAADGQTSMTGPLKASNGTAAAPSLTFASDTDTGGYRSGANEFSIAAGGSQIAAFSSSGIDAKTGKVMEAGGAIVPTGAVFDYAGSTAPTGFLLAYGQCVSRTTYAALFAVLSTTYDNGCSGTEFGIPDYRGRSGFGDDDMGGSAASRITNAGSGIVGTTLGASGGAQNVTIGQANLPNVNFAISGTGTISGGELWGKANTTSTQFNVGATFNVLVAEDFTGVSPTVTSLSGSAASGGSGTAVNKMPPAIIINKIIKY